MSKRKSKKSKNTMLIVFLVITFIIAIALLLYFFLWKENYGEIRENMTTGGQGKGYEEKCKDNCKEYLTCANKDEQGKGICKCKGDKTHISELTDERRKMFGRGTECISNFYLPINKCKSNKTHISKLTNEEQKQFFKGTECISNADLDIYNNDLGTKEGCNSLDGVWDGSKCLPPGSKIRKAKKDDFTWNLPPRYLGGPDWIPIKQTTGTPSKTLNMNECGLYAQHIKKAYQPEWPQQNEAPGCVYVTNDKHPAVYYNTNKSATGSCTEVRPCVVKKDD